MQDEKIKEAVETVRKGSHEVTWNKESSKEYNKALDTLLDLVSNFLAISGKMPEELRIKYYYYGGKVPNSYEDGWNQARQVCISIFARKLTGIEKVINRCRISFGESPSDIEELSEAIRKHLLD